MSRWRLAGQGIGAALFVVGLTSLFVVGSERARLGTGFVAVVGLVMFLAPFVIRWPSPNIKAEPVDAQAMTDDRYLILKVRLSNESASRESDSIARGVKTTLWFRDRSGKEPDRSMNGKWSAEWASVHTERLEAIGKGEPQEVDVAVKLKGASSAYAFNGKNLLWFPKRDDYCLPEHELAATHYRVQLRVSGTNFSYVDYWFLLTNSGDDFRLDSLAESP